MLLGIPYHDWLEALKLTFAVIAAVLSLAFFLGAWAELRIYRSGRR